MSEHRKKRIFTAVMTVGIVIVAIGILAIAGFQLVRGNRLNANAEVVSFLSDILPERTPGSLERRDNAVMPALSYDGKDYIALLENMSGSVKLPVLSVWDRLDALFTPCRLEGNPYEGSLILCLPDTGRQSDFVFSLDTGDTLTVTDMNGKVFRYSVAAIQHSSKADMNKLRDSDYDFSFFTGSDTSSGYVIVRCLMH